jgi:L-alanine-DL-glutamate epimerase-like enolase superfamily enzyme
MKITVVDVWLVEGVKYNWTMFKVHTDTGHTGVGEATNWPGSPVIEASMRHVGERVIGLDPLRTDFIWQKLYRDLNWIGPYGASMGAISGLDMALLDQGEGLWNALLRIAGRFLPQGDRAVCELLRSRGEDGRAARSTGRDVV